MPGILMDINQLDVYFIYSQFVDIILRTVECFRDFLPLQED